MLYLIYLLKYWVALKSYIKQLYLLNIYELFNLLTKLINFNMCL